LIFDGLSAVNVMLPWTPFGGKAKIDSNKNLSGGMLQLLLARRLA